MLRIAIALMLGGVAAAPAFAQQIVKCTDASNRIEYRNSPCPQGTRREAVEVSNEAGGEAERRGGVDRRSAIDRQSDAERASRAPAVQAPPAQPLLAPGTDRAPAGDTSGAVVPSERR